MGMFDNVKYEADCSKCGLPLDDFQSKAGPCVLNTYTPERLLEVGGEYAVFYDLCSCGEMNYFTIVPPRKMKIVRGVVSPELEDDDDND